MAQTGTCTCQTRTTASGINKSKLAGAVGALSNGSAVGETAVQFWARSRSVLFVMFVSSRV